MTYSISRTQFIKASVVFIIFYICVLINGYAIEEVSYTNGYLDSYEEIYEEGYNQAIDDYTEEYMEDETLNELLEDFKDKDEHQNRTADDIDLGADKLEEFII